MWRKLYFQNEQFDIGIRQLLRSGVVHVNHDTGLIEPTGNSMNYDSNWLFFGRTTALRDCFLWHQVMFNHFNQFVPEFCKLRCYKVVIKVRNFLEAIQFYNAIHAGPLARADLTLIHGKVGIDERYYTDGHFNGFVYCDGLEDALEKYEAVRELVNTQILNGSSIPIIIKRSCTEFEKAHGPTDNEFWNTVTPDERDFQSHIEDIFVRQTVCPAQPDWLKNRTITKMVKWANTVGDKSWIDYFGLDFLTMKAVTYHETNPSNNSSPDESASTPAQEE